MPVVRHVASYGTPALKVRKLFTARHDDGCGAVLVRLVNADLDDLADWLEDSYRLRAPVTLVRQLDAG